MNDNSSKVIDVDINEILPNRFQPRIQFDEDEILELSDSIKEHGVIQPLVVRTIGDKYEIIAGERRYKASVLAGKETVPVIIKNLNDKESAEIALIENIQRKNLTPIEEAISYKKILDMGYLTQSDLGVKLGKNQSSIANKIRLLNLSDDVQEALLDNKISERHARSLLRLKSLSEQNLMLKKILEERLTVRKTDEEIDKIKNKEEEKEVIRMNSEINPVINNSSQDAINFLGGNQPAQTIQMSPLGMPSGPILEPAAAPSFAMEIPQVQPAAQEVPATPSFAMEVPTMQPAAQEVPATPSFAMEIPQVQPVAQEVPATPSFAMEVPTMQPVAQEVPATPSFAMEIPQVQPVAQEVPATPSFAMEVPTMQPAVQEVPATPSFAMEIPQVQPVAQEVPATPSFAMEVPTMQPAAQEVPAAPSFAMEVPTMQPVAQEVPATPSFAMEVPETAPIIDETISNKDLEVSTNQNLLNVSEPIIVTDYNKQYDPLMANKNEFVNINKADFKEVINIIRECSSRIEKLGYKIELDEYDLTSLYQVEFKIEK